MAGRPINLNQARKARAREEARRRADANAAKHGRTKAERNAEAAEVERRTGALDAHRREDRPDDGDGPDGAA